MTSKGALFEYRSEQVSRVEGAEVLGRFHQPYGQSIFIVDQSVGVCVTSSRHDEQPRVRSHGASSLDGIGPGSRVPTTDRSNSGGRQRTGACKEWYLSRVGLMIATSARRRAISDSSSLMRSSRGWMRLSMAIISSRICAIVISSIRPGGHHERRREVISTVGE